MKGYRGKTHNDGEKDHSDSQPETGTSASCKRKYRQDKTTLL